jgi:hypothetical protein
MFCQWYHDSVGSEKEAMQKRYSIVVCMISSHVWKFGVQLLWEVEEVSKNPWVLAFRTRVSVCIAYNQSCVVVHKVVHSFSIVHKDWLYPFQTPCCAFWHISASLYIWSGHYARKDAGWRLFDPKKGCVVAGCSPVVAGCICWPFSLFVTFFTARKFWKLLFTVERGEVCYFLYLFLLLVTMINYVLLG